MKLALEIATQVAAGSIREAESTQRQHLAAVRLLCDSLMDGRLLSIIRAKPPRLIRESSHTPVFEEAEIVAFLDSISLESLKDIRDGIRTLTEYEKTSVREGLLELPSKFPSSQPVASSVWRHSFVRGGDTGSAFESQAALPETATGHLDDHKDQVAGEAFSRDKGINLRNPSLPKSGCHDRLGLFSFARGGEGGSPLNSLRSQRCELMATDHD